MINKTILQGRLVAAPELRSTQGGKPVASFTLAWSEKYGEREQQCFLPCVAWGKTGEHASRYFVKGQEAAAEGKLVTRKWQDQNGNNRATTELIVDQIHFCGPKRDSDTYSQNDDPQDQNSGFREVDEQDGDLPF